MRGGKNFWENWGKIETFGREMDFRGGKASETAFFGDLMGLP
jgi:hypothetical protein